MIAYENYVIAIENEYGPHADFLNCLNQDKAAFISLLEKGYIKSNSLNELSFQFVGIISIGEFLICVLPKYYQGTTYSFNDSIIELVRIIKVLKKVGASDAAIPDIVHFNVSDPFKTSELVLADKLIRDYLENGLYTKRQDLQILNGWGEINWNTTVTNVLPIFSSRRPIYHEAYTSEVVAEQFSVITELHKWLLKRCLKRFGRLLDYNFLFDQEAITELTELGSLEFLANVIRKELGSTYGDRDIWILKRMLSFLDHTQNGAADSFTIFGTGYFHQIWEITCGAVFANKKHEFESQIPLPKWHDLAENSQEKNTLRPDIVSISNLEKPAFFIFDTKYYNVNQTYNPRFSVTGNPGIEDVGKQFLYREALKDVNYSDRYNCFLFPKLMAKLFYVFGSVSFSIFPGSRIQNIYLSPNEIFDYFLINRILDSDQWLALTHSIETASNHIEN